MCGHWGPKRIDFEWAPSIDTKNKIYDVIESLQIQNIANLMAPKYCRVHCSHDGMAFAVLGMLEGCGDTSLKRSPISGTWQKRFPRMHLSKR